ncbi:hypothetical protein ACXR0O_12070 [Verrucomicrobiota bacterium sgz303538]
MSPEIHQSVFKRVVFWVRKEIDDEDEEEEGLPTRASALLNSMCFMERDVAEESFSTRSKCHDVGGNGTRQSPT